MQIKQERMSTRLTATVLALLALAACPVVAGATHSNGEGPERDFATGTAIRTAVLPNGSDTRVMMEVSARSGASGENAGGRFFVKRTTDPPVAGRPDLDFSGRVTCLRIVGNRAIVGGVVTRDNLDLPSNQIEGTGFLGVYVDNDQLGDGTDDEANSRPGLAPPGNTCPTSAPFPTVPFQQGNYVIHADMP